MKHKIQRAIIMAAGKGERLRPVTEKVPKPLVSVNGTRMIDSIINALHYNGIYEIYIVVGYLQEQFSFLERTIDGIQLVRNPFFEECNNISSLYVAREHIDNAIILDGDQLVKDPRVLEPEFELSGYNAVWTEGLTKEWLMEVQNGIVKSCSRTGGEKGWQLYSISRWSSEDGKKLKHHLEIEFEQRMNRNIYWDDVPLFCYPREYKLGIKPMQHGDIIEIDNFDELVALDSQYKRSNR